MKIYFAAAVTGGRDFGQYYKKIVKFLKEMGHQVLSEHVVYWSKQKAFRKKAQRAKDFYKFISDHNKKLINKADLLIAECSQGSLGTGFEICYGAYVRKIPVVCLRHEEAKGRTSSTIFGDNSKLIRGYSYNGSNLEKVLSKAVDSVING